MHKYVQYSDEAKEQQGLCQTENFYLNKLFEEWLPFLMKSYHIPSSWIYTRLVLEIYYANSQFLAYKATKIHKIALYITEK